MKTTKHLLRLTLFLTATALSGCATSLLIEQCKTKCFSVAVATADDGSGFNACLDKCIKRGY